MPIDLTGDDRAYLCSRIDESLRSENEYRSLIEDVYRAGLAAGRERAIEECAGVCEHNATLYNEMGTGWESSVECAAAIRALK